jgi:DNA mismatch endonuclease (patch repair protein)
MGLRYRVDVATLPGRPDIVFPRQRLALFCDGDFWHGRDLDKRLRRLGAGHNAPYWTAKIRTNVARDRQVDSMLAALGWRVLRLWESDIKKDLGSVAARVRIATCGGATDASQIRRVLV